MMVALWFDHSEWQDFLVIPNPQNEPGIKLMWPGRWIRAHEHALFPVLRHNAHSADKTSCFAIELRR
ncbi:MAG: hypothetical protein M3178_04930 [Pseudomonadota bacterium]|nr:hypothetical protein [Pseudomonadota bacterium]